MSEQTNERPLVSIVLPTYNRAAYLGSAIESCLAQTWEPLELIIVDDGSSDHTPEVAAEWVRRDARVRYIRQENGKIPRALNTGFREARGTFLTWTSDDNFYEPEALAVMATFLSEHPDVGLVYCDYQQIDDAGEYLGLCRRRPPSEIERANVIGACFMYRRSVAEQIGQYDPNAFLAEDYDYWLRISKVAPLAHLEATPYKYRLHEASLTSLREAEAEIQAAKVRTKHARTRREWRAIMAAGYCVAATELRMRARYRAAFTYYLRAAWLNPAGAAAYRGMAASLMLHRPRAAA